MFFVKTLLAGIGNCPCYFSTVTVKGVFLKTIGDASSLGPGTASLASMVSGVC